MKVSMSKIHNMLKIFMIPCLKLPHPYDCRSEHLIFRSNYSSLSSYVLVFYPLWQVFSVTCISSLLRHGVIWQGRLRPEWGLKAYRKPEPSLLIFLSHLLCLQKCSTYFRLSSRLSLIFFSYFTCRLFRLYVSWGTKLLTNRILFHSF